MLKSKYYIALFLLAAFYISGIIGIATNAQTINFLSLTPLNLFVNLGLLVLNHENGSNKQVVLFISIIILGFIIEVIGVNTGFIFGRYAYGLTLGWKILETPVIIGVNWLILTYAVVYTINIHNKIILTLLSAIVLVLLDFLIEPVAMAYDFWGWYNNEIPVKNYLAWFAISLLFCYIIAFYKEQSHNRLAPYILFFQFAFFGIFNFILWK